jgi:hypothetical protein
MYLRVQRVLSPLAVLYWHYFAAHDRSQRYTGKLNGAEKGSSIPGWLGPQSARARKRSIRRSYDLLDIAGLFEVMLHAQ